MLQLSSSYANFIDTTASLLVLPSVMRYHGRLTIIHQPCKESFNSSMHLEQLYQRGQGLSNVERDHDYAHDYWLNA